ncbi:dicarboxylate/amino acid:cation symporter [Sphingomonas sp. ID0503]|uniref:dicarboxylate/amino acid:cation symporter n=1 Tax=Sphingomonas sp. ID0503 TaxID=3399691 RepID=UPI003AFAF15C
MIKARPLRLLAGLAIGLIAGIAAGDRVPALLQIAEPIGSLWLSALTMTVVPLVFGLLVNGICTASRAASAGGTTLRAFVTFAAMLILATVTAAACAESLLRLWPVIGVPPQGIAPVPPMEGAWYQGIIPANPIKAAADTAMVPLVVFALFLGFALARIDAALADTLLRPLQALVEAMLVIVGWVLLVAPIGIAALAVGAGASLGSSAFGLLGQYVVVVAVCCLAATVLAYGWAAFGGAAPHRFAAATLSAQSVALGTQSSLASLPLMVEAAGRLGVRKTTTGIVLPLAVSIFRAASAAANVGVAVYLAHLHGVPLGVSGLAIVALVAVPVSLGAVGLPAQVSFFATIAPVCIAVGVPTVMLPLLLAIEAVPDLFRTVGNVTNDIAAACVADGRRRAA